MAKPLTDKQKEAIDLLERAGRDLLKAQEISGIPWQTIANNAKAATAKTGKRYFDGIPK